MINFICDIYSAIYTYICSKWQAIRALKCSNDYLECQMCVAKHKSIKNKCLIWIINEKPKVIYFEC